MQSYSSAPYFNPIVQPVSGPEPDWTYVEAVSQPERQADAVEPHGAAPPPQIVAPGRHREGFLHRNVQHAQVPVKWQRQLNSWEKIQDKFGLHDSRYEDFEYLTFLDIDDEFVRNYVSYQRGLSYPIIKGRLSAHSAFWETLDTPEWVKSFIRHGFRIPFEKNSDPMIFPDQPLVKKI